VTGAVHPLVDVYVTLCPGATRATPAPVKRILTGMYWSTFCGFCGADVHAVAHGVLDDGAAAGRPDRHPGLDRTAEDLDPAHDLVGGHGGTGATRQPTTRPSVGAWIWLYAAVWALLLICCQ
jgi:hypothetical protein